MKVTGKQPHNISELTVGKTPGKGGKADQSRPPQAEETETAANRTSLNIMSKIRESIRNEPDVRAERVAELRAKVRRGDVKVDPDKLAEKMIAASLREDLERP